jgi:hypothetical protein
MDDRDPSAVRTISTLGRSDQHAVSQIDQRHTSQVSKVEFTVVVHKPRCIEADSSADWLVVLTERHGEEHLHLHLLDQRLVSGWLVPRRGERGSSQDRVLAQAHDWENTSAKRPRQITRLSLCWN